MDRNLNSDKMHFRSKFGDSSLNGWWIMVRTSSKFDFQVKFDLDLQGRSSSKTNETYAYLFRISGPNLVILTWMSDELSCGQARSWYTHSHTRIHRPTDAADDSTWRPKLALGKIKTQSNPHENHLLLIAYTFLENQEFVLIIIAQFMMSTNSRIRFGLRIVFVFLNITPSHYHHCASLSEDIELIKWLSDIFGWVCESDKAYSLNNPSYNMWSCVLSVYPFPLW